MESKDFQAEFERRAQINEDRRPRLYYDDRGIPTIGIGFNLQRPDADAILHKVASSLHVVMLGATLTDTQIDQLFSISFAPILGQCLALIPNFNALSDARRMAIADMCFQMGYGDDGLGGFTNTLALIDEAAIETDPDTKHADFAQIGQNLKLSAWYRQSGDRAKRNISMIVSSSLVDPKGTG